MPLRFISQSDSLWKPALAYVFLTVTELGPETHCGYIVGIYMLINWQNFLVVILKNAFRSIL